MQLTPDEPNGLPIARDNRTVILTLFSSKDHNICFTLHNKKVKQSLLNSFTNTGFQKSSVLFIFIGRFVVRGRQTQINMEFVDFADPSEFHINLLFLL